MNPQGSSCDCNPEPHSSSRAFLLCSTLSGMAVEEGVKDTFANGSNRSASQRLIYRRLLIPNTAINVQRCNLERWLDQDGINLNNGLIFAAALKQWSQLTMG